jgi:hypothetical protein
VRLPNRDKDPVLQNRLGPLLVPALLLNLDGVGQGFSGPNGTFTVNSAPPRKRLGHKRIETTLRYAEQSDAVADAELRERQRRRNRPR